MKSSIWAVLILFAIWSIPGGAQVSVTTSRNDNSRDGQNLSETILTPGNVNVAAFGKLFSHTVDGDVYAQPLYVPNVTVPGLGVHNLVYVVTEHDSVYAFDADSNTGLNSAPLWHSSFVRPRHGITTVSYLDLNCPTIIPEVGITSSPVIDLDTGTMYVLARTKENGNYVQRLHALDIATGEERSGSPVMIRAAVVVSGEGSTRRSIAFDPFHEAQRAGLLLQNGGVYIAWASSCDNKPFHGWVMSYDKTTLQQTAAWISTPQGQDGGIWQSGTGLSADSDFNVFFATGNGTFNSLKGDFGDSVIKLVSPAGGNNFQVADYFTPYDQSILNNIDSDVGSGGSLLLPDQGQRAPHQHLLIQVGKEGSIYLIDRDHMGHYNPRNNHQIVQDLENAIGGLWSTPAWWNNNVYFGSIDDNLSQFTFDPATGLLSTSAIHVSPTRFGYPGPTPSISANGTSDAILWALQTDAFGQGSAILHAYDATDVATELYNSSQNSSRDDPGGAIKFTVPTVANGKVYVPAMRRLTVYGLLGKK